MSMHEISEGLSNFIPYLSILALFMGVIAVVVTVTNHDRFLKANKILAFTMIAILTYFFINSHTVDDTEISDTAHKKQKLSD